MHGDQPDLTGTLDSRTAEPSTRFDADTVRSAMTHAATGLTRTIAANADEDAALRAIVAGAVHAIPAAAGASITLLDRQGAITTHAPSTDLIAEIDRTQTRTREGPCIDALDDVHPGITDAADLTAHSPWPRFAEKALAAGMHAVLSFQLLAVDAAGALNLYCTTAHGFGPDDHLIGALFADQAAIALAGVRRADQLNTALRTRDTIGQAKGILMERFGLTDPQAFQMLVSASQDTNMKLHDVAVWTVSQSRCHDAPKRRDG